MVIICLIPGNLCASILFNNRKPIIIESDHVYHVQHPKKSKSKKSKNPQIQSSPANPEKTLNRKKSPSPSLGGGGYYTRRGRVLH